MNKQWIKDPYTLEAATGHVEDLGGGRWDGRCRSCRVDAKELYTPEELQKWQDARKTTEPKKEKMTEKEYDEALEKIECLR
jgi:hypothetical protein